MNMDAAITPLELQQRLAAFPPPHARRRAPRSRRSTRDPRRHPRRDAAPARDGRRTGRRRSSRGGRSSSIACTATRSARTPRRRCAQRGLDARYLEGGLERWRADGGATTPFARADALGHARAAEDRPHRVPVARPALHRSVGGVLLRADRGSARVRRGARRDAVRHSRRRVHARRRRVQLRRVHPPPRARRSGARRARDDRARRRHRRARARAAGAGPARGVARAVGDVRRRPRDAALGHARLRRALRVVPRRAGETHGWYPERCASRPT